MLAYLFFSLLLRLFSISTFEYAGDGRAGFFSVSVPSESALTASSSL